MDPLPPISVPRGHRWREFKIKQIPVIIFSAALVAAGFIWKNHATAPTYIGEVETIRASVISTVPGHLVEMTVNRFDKVAKGQVIAKIFPADPELLKASLAGIEIELKTLQRRVTLDDDRNKLNYEQLRLAWLGQRVELATARVNLQFAESELVRQATLHAEKIVPESEYELARNLRDARREEVVERSKLVTETDARLNELRSSEAGPDASAAADSLRQAVAAQEAQLLLTEGPIALKAPIDGVVSSLEHRAGERVMAGAPIVVITSPQSSRIVAFARQPLYRVPEVGDRVQVRTRRAPRNVAMANVLAVGSGVEIMAAQPSNGKGMVNVLGNPLERGLSFSVSLPDGFAALPGETVDLLILR